MGNKHSRSSPESAQHSRQQRGPVGGSTNQDASATQHPSVLPINIPPHLANQFINNPRPNRSSTSGPTRDNSSTPQAPQQQRGQGDQTQQPAQPQAQSQLPQQAQNNTRRVQEGQMLKMLATIESSTVSYNPSAQLLTFYITSIAPSLTYEIHTGVKEFVKGGDVFYMPNKPKMEPTRILIKGPQENRKIPVKLDISKLEEKEKVFNKHYPKQMPCVIVLRYRTTELRKKENADSKTVTNGNVSDNKENSEDTEEVVVEHTEHTAVDLAERPKRRVISQIVTAGGNAYVVENLYGAGHENTAGGSGSAEVMVGSTIVPHEGEEEEEGLCVICLMNSKDTAVMPCRHMCMCKDCGEQLLKHKPVCPVCRAPISTLLHMPSFTEGGSK